MKPFGRRGHILQFDDGSHLVQLAFGPFQTFESPRTQNLPHNPLSLFPGSDRVRFGELVRLVTFDLGELVDLVDVSSRVTSVRVRRDLLVQLDRSFAGGMGISIGGSKVRGQMLVVERGHPRGVRRRQGGVLGLEVRDMRLHKGQVELSGSSLNPLDNRLDRPIPSLSSSLDGGCVRRLDRLDVNRSSSDPVKPVFDERVDVRLQDVSMIHVGGVAERLVELRVSSRVVVQPQGGEGESGNR